VIEALAVSPAATRQIWRYLLDVDWMGSRPGYRVGAAVERTDAEPDLRLDVSALASVYLGGFTFAQLARALRLKELRERAVARADALFRSDRAPWCPEIF
jgi:hypothetical protein